MCTAKLGLTKGKAPPDETEKRRENKCHSTIQTETKQWQKTTLLISYLNMHGALLATKVRHFQKMKASKIIPTNRSKILYQK